MSKPWEETWEAEERKIYDSDGLRVAEFEFGVDASLAAAAPDLYRALENLRPLCTHNQGYSPDVMSVLNAADSAMAKARGE